MNSTDRQAHWQNVYATKAEKEVSWFQESPAQSLDLIADTGISTDASIIDVGGGASRLVDSLFEKGFRRVAYSTFPQRPSRKRKSGSAIAETGSTGSSRTSPPGSLRARMISGMIAPPFIF